MNKAEAIEAMKNKYVYWQNAVGIIDSIQPTTDEAWEVIKKEYNIEIAENLKTDLDKLVKYESLNLKISNILKVDIEELVEHVAINGLAKPQKVLIPKFVAKWIKFCKSHGYSLKLALAYPNDREFEEAKKWILSNEDVFARAWIDDNYEVEKEKLYRVELPVEINSAIVSVLKKYPSGEVNIGLIRKAELKTATRIRFTEQEIKSIDERYWVFAVAVEETDNEI